MANLFLWSVLHQLNDAYAVYTSSRTKGEVKTIFQKCCQLTLYMRITLISY